MDQGIGRSGLVCHTEHEQHLQKEDCLSVAVHGQGSQGNEHSKGVAKQATALEAIPIRKMQLGADSEFLDRLSCSPAGALQPSSEGPPQCARRPLPVDPPAQL